MGLLAGAVLAGEDPGGPNREVFHADTVAPEELVSAGQGLPLFGTRRLILVRGLADAPAKTVERLRLAVEVARARPAGWPEAGTTVVLVAGGANRRAPALRVVPEADQVEVPTPAGPAVVAWLRERARAARLDLAPEAAQTLIALTGDDLSRLASELDKVALFVGADGRIGDDAVRALAGEGRVRQYWELTQALEGGDRPGALRVLESLLDAGEEPVALLGQLAGHVRDIWRAQAALAQRMTARQLAGLLPRRRPEWAVERLMARAAGWGGRELAAAVRRLFETEQRLKSSGGDPRTLLTTLVADLGRS